ncbi:MAG: D-Ala-D-Ala carboxypeptidase family metallohydrolase [Myxococcota bacterium]|nr:D-Ala-D-Ala carboxypeptidase family metallohydrolase [Myxococcota bacterium]
MKHWRESVILVILCACMLRGLWLFDFILAPLYDLASRQQPVESKKDLLRVYQSFQTVRYAQIPDWVSRYQVEKYGHSKRYQRSEFLRISWFERYRFVVGRHRVKDFMTKDRLFREHVPIPHLDKVQILCLDKQLLLRLLELKTALKKKGMNPDAFSITSGFRPSSYNQLVKGASRSQHLWGNAIDLWVSDVDKNGKVNRKDSDEVYRLLDQKIIGSKGGVGKYESYRLLHMDTRGKRARWDYSQ